MFPYVRKWLHHFKKTRENVVYFANKHYAREGALRRMSYLQS